MLTNNPHVRLRVYDLHNGICGICNKHVNRAEMHLDHVIPISAGGPDEESNLQPAHPSCNFSKGGLYNGLRPNQRAIAGRGPLEKLQARLPRDVWQEMKDWAQAEDRSLNAQIIWVLRRALENRARK